MRIKYFVFFLLFYSIIYGKKNIIIMTSRGGGGHISASKALIDYLKDDYNIKSTVLLEDIIGYSDPIQLLTLKKYTSDDLYNYLLRNRWIRTINILSTVSRASVSLMHAGITDKVIRYLKEQNPNLVISVIPIFNAILYDACLKLSIPLTVITVDLDTQQYINGFKKNVERNLTYTLPFDDFEMITKISPPINKYLINITGFPIRQDFFELKDKNKIKQAFNINREKQIIMLMMGATGSTQTYDFLKELLKLTYPIHIIICLGRNEQLGKKILRLKLPSNITISMFGFTEKISDLMAISDLLITKPGPTSLCEAIYLNLPTIIDNTGTNLWWEDFNIEFLKKNKLGEVLTDLAFLNNLVNKILQNKLYHETIKFNLKNLTKVDPKIAIKKIIDQKLT